MTSIYARFSISVDRIKKILAEATFPINALSVAAWGDQEYGGAEVTGPGVPVMLLIGLVATVCGVPALEEALLL